MTYTCPQGHQSSTADFCDVCGDPIDAGMPSNPGDPGAAAADPGAAAAAPPSSLTLPDPPATHAPMVTCPNCATENPADALFCEGCGYDFTTGQLPTPPGAVPAGVDWVAELWIDPEWFEHQDAPGGCATSGAPTVVPLRATTVTVGRASKSRGLAPDLDCTNDGAVSHEHAQFVLDHDRWYVEDLGSTNGTFVGSPGEPLPDTPLPPHQRRELADDERVYVGAWTRIMIRRATDNEKAGVVT